MKFGWSDQRQRPVSRKLPSSWVGVGSCQPGASWPAGVSFNCMPGALQPPHFRRAPHTLPCLPLPFARRLPVAAVCGVQLAVPMASIQLMTKYPRWLHCSYNIQPVAALQMSIDRAGFQLPCNWPCGAPAAGSHTHTAAAHGSSSCGPSSSALLLPNKDTPVKPPYS